MNKCKKLAEKLYHFKEKRKKKKRSSRESERIKQMIELYPLELPDKKIEQFECDRLEKLIRSGIVVVIVLIITAMVQEVNGVLKKQEYLVRNDSGSGNGIVHLLALIEGKEIPIEFVVEERELNKEEKKQLFMQAEEELDRKLLGENLSLDYVTSDLYLPEQAADGLIDVEWSFDSYEIFYPDGKKRDVEIDKDGVVVKLTAVLTYQKETCEYIQYLHAYEKSMTKEEIIQKQLKTVLEEANEASKTEKTFFLPMQLGNVKIAWKEQSDYLLLKLVGVAVLILVLFYYQMEQNLKRQCEERRQQLQMDYPKIVNQISLLLGAGMSIFAAWKKIVQNYESSNATQQRFVYEEMKVSCYQLEEGMSEGKVYEAFGKRCGIRQYMKFTGLLTQNLKKGASGIEELLNQEVLQAFEERKAIAKQLGEEASTKMLLPMGILLIIILLIIVIPGFLSF